MLLGVEPKLKKKKGAEYFALDDDIDQEWVLKHQAFLVDEQRQKIEKKFQKENEKLVAEGSKEMKAKELKERMDVADELEKKFKKENKSKKVEAEGRGPTVERLEENIKKLDQKIENLLLQAADKEENKEVALGTSKIVRVGPYHPSGPDTDGGIELHRPAPDGGLLEEVQRADREVLLQDAAGEV